MTKNPLTRVVNKYTVEKIKCGIINFCDACNNEQLTKKLMTKIKQPLKTVGDFYFLMECDRYYNYPFLTSLFQLSLYDGTQPDPVHVEMV